MSLLGQNKLKTKHIQIANTLQELKKELNSIN